MKRARRLQLMRAALEEVFTADDRMAVFADTGRESTIRVYRTMEERRQVVEILPLDVEVEDLEALGFINVAQDPAEGHYQQWMQGASPERIAQLCEKVFATLESESSFDLKVTVEPIPQMEGLRALLALQRSAPWYRDSDSRVADPLIIFCSQFASDGNYEGFTHEEDVVVGQLASLVDCGLPAELAWEGLRAYGYEPPSAYTPGEPVFLTVELDADVGFTLPESHAFQRLADRLEIEGVHWGDGSPLSGDFLVVETEDALEELREALHGAFRIVEIDPGEYMGGPHGISLELIERARASETDRLLSGE